MSVQRPQRDCPLCHWSLSDDIHKAIYYAYQANRSWEDAAEVAKKNGLSVDVEAVRSHLQYHRIIQPAPKTRLRPERERQRAQKLPQRLREMLLLSSRVPALSGTQLAELFYWTGQERQFASARNACYRDLRRLVLENFLYRWYPPTAVGPRGSRVRSSQHRLSFFCLGRDASPYIEAIDGYEPVRGKDYIQDVADLPEQHELFAMNGAAEAISSLARQCRIKQAAGTVMEIKDVRALPRFSPLNWYGPRRCLLPAGAAGPTAFQIGGLAAFGYTFPGRDASVLCPFLYEYDDGVTPLESLADHIISYLDLKRSGALSGVFPQLSSFFPPVLVIARTPFRGHQLRLEVQERALKRSSESSAMIAVVCDQPTVARDGFSEEAWISLWDRSEEPHRYMLSEVLLRSARSLIEAGLRADISLAYKAPSKK